MLMGVTLAQTTYTTTDSFLDKGKATTTTYYAASRNGLNGFVKSATNSSDILWLMYDDPYAITSGTGTIKQTYSGAGSLTTTIDLTGLPTSPVVAYPFVLYGCDPYNDCYNGQPPKFPKQLSTIQSLIVDTAYALTCTTCGKNVDILYDEWLLPKAGFSGGPAGAFEVEIFPYYKFAELAGCAFVKTVTYPAVVNGIATNLAWDDYLCAKGQGGASQFIMHTRPGMKSGELAIDLMDFFRQVVTDAKLSLYWYAPGLEIGTELGDAPTQNYQLKLTKLKIAETLK